MPSGAKKRKAAKKKKEIQSNNHSNPSSASASYHGEEDVTHEENKEIDVGEVSSPGSQDHHNNQSFSTEGEEEEIEKERNLSSLPREEGQSKNIVVEEAEKEFKIEDVLARKDGRVEHDEAARKSYDGGSSRSSSSGNSSSDDESHERSAKVIHSAPVKESEKIPVLGKHVEVDMSSVSKENGERKLSSIEDKVGTSVALVDSVSEREEEPIIQSVEITATDLNPKDCVTQENDDRLTLPYDAPRATADNGAKNERDSGVTEPLLVPSPSPVQKTSWKSCCGLFEVFSGSGS